MKNKVIVTITGILIIAGFRVGAQTVVLDYYFNHEVHTNKSGQAERFHYMWEDKANTGFSILGDDFVKNGVKLKSLDAAPTIKNLKTADIYIIVDPDTKKESSNPNCIEEKEIDQIVKWVKKGGVLVMFANDSANVELPHFNNLAARFGMHFNNDLQNHVIDDTHFDDGGIVTAGNTAFKSAALVFMKDVCSIGLISPAEPLLKNSNGAVIIATAKYGNGTVLAIGDPWLYNEYVNGRLPAKFENDKAGDDIVKWLVAQIPAAK